MTIIWIMIGHLVVPGWGALAGQRINEIPATDMAFFVYPTRQACEDVKKQYNFHGEHVTCEPRLIAAPVPVEKVKP